MARDYYAEKPTMDHPFDHIVQRIKNYEPQPDREGRVAKDTRELDEAAYESLMLQVQQKTIFAQKALNKWVLMGKAFNCNSPEDVRALIERLQSSAWPSASALSHTTLPSTPGGESSAPVGSVLEGMTFKHQNQETPETSEKSETSSPADDAVEAVEAVKSQNKSCVPVPENNIVGPLFWSREQQQWIRCENFIGLGKYANVFNYEDVGVIRRIANRGKDITLEFQNSKCVTFDAALVVIEPAACNITTELPPEWVQARVVIRGGVIARLEEACSAPCGANLITFYRLVDPETQGFLGWFVREDFELLPPTEEKKKFVASKPVDYSAMGRDQLIQRCKDFDQAFQDFDARWTARVQLLESRLEQIRNIAEAKSG